MAFILVQGCINRGKMSLFLLYFPLLCISCGRVEHSSQIEKIETYYPNGQLKQVFHYQKGTKNGQVTSYYLNGAIDYQASIRNDRHSGTTKYYDSLTGKIVKHVNYVILADTSVSYPNEVIYFEKNGNIKNDAPNLYYTFSFVKDSLSIRDTFYYKLDIVHPYFGRHEVYICDFDSVYQIIDSASCGYGKMQDASFAFIDIPKKSGINYVRGYIISDSLRDDKPIAMADKHSLTYFETKYYVYP